MDNQLDLAVEDQKTTWKDENDDSKLTRRDFIDVDIDSDSDKIENNSSQNKDDSNSDEEIEIVQVKPPSTLSRPPAQVQPLMTLANNMSTPTNPHYLFTPYFYEKNPNLKPTWAFMHCDCASTAAAAAKPMGAREKPLEAHFYKFHLLSQTEFSVRSSKTTSMQRIGVSIRKIARENSCKATFENGIWRIPLAIYQPLFTFLTSISNTFVEGIPNGQLKIVAMARAAAQTTESSPNQLIHLGVPYSLALALAPYQRAGVDFILKRGGRALIADEMGLGKSIQSIAAMCCYRNQWPLMVICPSSASHHWKNEFIEWLSHPPKEDDTSTKQSESIMKRRRIEKEDFYTKDEGFMCHEVKAQGTTVMDNEKQHASLKKPYISSHEIQIVTSSKSTIGADPNTHIVICSYGFASQMVAAGTLTPGMFKCIIADESHLIKNKNSQRTKNLSPILQSTNRLILLSGTPALSRPIELYPQISVIGSMEQLGWSNEDAFIQKYCKGLTDITNNDVQKNNDNQEPNDLECIERNPSLMELHTLLTATIMLRRLKKDILKYLPPKTRQRLLTVTRDPVRKQTMMDAMAILIKGKGVLANMAKSHSFSESSGMGAPIQRNSSTSDTEPVSERKAVLNQLFCQSGEAKIPIIVELLNKFILDPSKGKLCIFAHHASVMDALIQQSKLSDNDCKYIRIDGSTSPKERQEKAKTFQSDGAVRIAILGIVSAGVALTLTASSTVWFAELFWTPAMLLQAEDRCHRIGQQSSVRCVYFVLRESLDELLWKLIQKKFSELGEFVEGQGNQNMIIHHDYCDEHEAMKSWFMDETNSEDKPSAHSSPFDFTYDDDEDFRRCLEELARDDCDNKINESDGIDGNVITPDICNNDNDIMGASEKPLVSQNASSTEQLINLVDLSDDDEGKKIPHQARDNVIQTLLNSEHFLKEMHSVLPNAYLPQLRLYRYYFPQNFELVAGLQFLCGRFINTRAYYDRTGNACRPGIGDVIVGFQGRIFGVIRQVDHAEKISSIFHATFQSQPYVEVIFGEDPSFRSLLEMYNKSGDSAISAK